MIEKIAQFIVNRRLLIAILVLATTGFLLYHALHIPIQTFFPDLLPQNHPFVKLIKKHPKFGGTNSVIIGMEVIFLRKKPSRKSSISATRFTFFPVLTERRWCP